MDKETKKALDEMKTRIEAAKGREPAAGEPATQSITNAGGIESQERVGTPGREADPED